MKKNGKNKDEGEKLHLRYWLAGLAVIAVIAGVVMLISVISDINDRRAAEAAKIVFTETPEGNLYDEKNNLTYYPVPSEYCAEMILTSDYYGRIGETKLYQLAYKDSTNNDKEKLVDATQWIAKNDADGGTLYRTDGQALPALDEFDSAYVVSDDIISTSLMSLTSGRLVSLIQSLKASVGYAGMGSPYETYSVVMKDETKKWINYQFYLVRCSNGDYYVYTDSHRAGIQVDGGLFSASLGGAVE